MTKITFAFSNYAVRGRRGFLDKSVYFKHIHYIVGIFSRSLNGDCIGKLPVAKVNSGDPIHQFETSSLICYRHELLSDGT